MFLLWILRALVETHLLLCLATLLFAAAQKLSHSHRALPWVRLGQALLLIALILPITTSLLPRKILARPIAQIWTGGARTANPYSLIAPAPTQARTFPITPSGWRVPNVALRFTLLFVVLGMFLSLANLCLQRRRLALFLRAQLPWKKIGCASLLVTSQTIVPFSAHFRGQAYVVLPARILGTPAARIAFRHEATHHRHGDTRWVYGMAVVSALLFANPAARFFAWQIERLQEFACDEAVVSRGITAAAYGQTLFAVARWASGPVGSRGMGPTFLRRRLERLVQPKMSARAFSALLLCGLMVGMTAAAFFLRSTLQDRRLSLSEAKNLVLVPSNIPLEANEFVLARLNHYIGTPEGRRIVKNGLRRMPQYQSMIETKMHEYGVPSELIAIPLFESAFNNKARSPVVGAAGIWQFVIATARRYGLVVDHGQRDERTQPEQETIAAMRYLRDLHAEFGDWRLAIKAYNEGEKRVRELIRQTGTRDPWRLERANSAENYLSGAIATMILLKNPRIVD